MSLSMEIERSFLLRIAVRKNRICCLPSLLEVLEKFGNFGKIPQEMLL
jgi:hypothetical protein